MGPRAGVDDVEGYHYADSVFNVFVLFWCGAIQSLEDRAQKAESVQHNIHVINQPFSRMFGE
jgi:hypothetical protein